MLDAVRLVSEVELALYKLLAPLEFNSLMPDALESCKVDDFFLGDVIILWEGLGMSSEVV